MKITILQPPYPGTGTVGAAEECLRWMSCHLEALRPGSHDLVLLPEYANCPGLNNPTMAREFSASHGAELLTAAGLAAQRLHCLVALSALMPSGGRWFNRTLVYTADGWPGGHYDKLHLTDPEREVLEVTPGSAPVVLELAGLRLGFATCFDLSFSEYSSTLAAQRLDLILCPSYQRSESTGRIHLQAQARALDSGAHLLRSSYAMPDPSVGGCSLVAAPSGELLADAGAEPGSITVELDPHQPFLKPSSHGQPLAEHRTVIETHRRPEVYRPQSELAQRLTARPSPHLCAHRGLSLACPENTLPAFGAALAVGVHEIEFDLWPSRDGVPVVCHDASVDRTTNGSGAIADLTWEEIRQLDAGVRTSEHWRGVGVPRFEQLLDLAAGRCGLNIHIKGVADDPRMLWRVCDLLNERGLGQTAYLALGSEQDLQAALDYAPELTRACLAYQHDSDRSIETAARYRCRRIQLGRHVTAEQLQLSHALGLINNLFWSDEPEDALAYARRGIDVILTNCAHTLVAGGVIWDGWAGRAG